MKEQRGFRLEEAVLKDIDNYCEKMEMSYNAVITQCIRIAFPALKTEAYYKLRMAGVTPEMLAGDVVKMVESRAKKNVL